VAYDELARAFLLRAKLGGHRELLEPLGLQLARAIELRGLARGCGAIVAVPSHPWVNLRRGFAPAAVLARIVGRHLGLPMLTRALARRLASGLTARRLGARKRRTRLAGVLRVRRRVAGERLLLVDDVMTTGATAEACALALKRAGAVEVRVATWARTLPRS
jgi:predicted amidophosphoribosyltransferase